MPNAPDDIEREILEELEKDSIQARARKAPWDTTTFPGLGPGIGDTIFGGNSHILLAGARADEILPWSPYPMRRDKQLRELWKTEGIMSGAVYSMAARIKALPYKVKGLPRAKSKTSDLLHGFEVGRWAVDFLTTDNGAFIEKLGPGRPDKYLPKSLVRGLAHMDSNQCWRTFDPEFPVIYVNPYTGQFHKIHYSRVVISSSMPQPNELARGIGFCPISRTNVYIQTARDLMIYKHEKVSGQFTRAVALAKGFASKTLKNTLEADKLADEAVGFTRYRGIPMLSTMDTSAGLELVDFASVPDGFDFNQDIVTYVNIIALGMGTDAREFWPATASGATKADATVQHEKARGKGIGDIIQTLEHLLNWQCIPDGAEMEYDYTDDAEDLAVSQLHFQRITNVTLLQTSGNLTPQQGNAILVSQGVLDPAVLTIEGAENSMPIDDSSPAYNSTDRNGMLTIPVPEQQMQQAEDRANFQQQMQQNSGNEDDSEDDTDTEETPQKPAKKPGFSASDAQKGAKVPAFSKKEQERLFDKVRSLPKLKDLRDA